MRTHEEIIGMLAGEYRAAGYTKEEITEMISSAKEITYGDHNIRIVHSNDVIDEWVILPTYYLKLIK